MGFSEERGRVLFNMLACFGLILLTARSSEGMKINGTGALPADFGPDRRALEAVKKRIASDYADIDALHPLKAHPDKTHFEYNVSFYADAAHFEENPASLEKELNQIIPHLDDWVDDLKEPGFSVKLHYTLKKVFAPGDRNRIAYNHQAREIRSEDVWEAMKENTLLKEDFAHIIFLLIPYREDQEVSSQTDLIRGVASITDFRELGLGLSKVYTKKSIKDQVLVKTRTGYKWKWTTGEYDMCLLKKTCYLPVTSKKKEKYPADTLIMDTMIEAVKIGQENAPTLELVDTVINRNLSGYQKHWVGVLAHELGHLLGAGERGAFKSIDEDRIMWDVMLNPSAGTKYGDTSKYAIFLNIACEIRLNQDDDVYRSIDIHSRYCNIPERFYYRRTPWWPGYHKKQDETPSSEFNPRNSGNNGGRQNSNGNNVRRSSTGGSQTSRNGRGFINVRQRSISDYSDQDANSTNAAAATPTVASAGEGTESTRAYLVSLNKTGQEQNLLLKTADRSGGGHRRRGKRIQPRTGM